MSSPRLADSVHKVVLQGGLHRTLPAAYVSPGRRIVAWEIERRGEEECGEEEARDKMDLNAGCHGQRELARGWDEEDAGGVERRKKRMKMEEDGG